MDAEFDSAHDAKANVEASTPHPVEGGAPGALPPLADETATPTSIGPCEGARVLVIEDETPVANFLKEALEAKGCSVRVAADGAEGLEMFRASQPDLVICDLLLPKRNGFRLIEDFKAEAPNMPVIATTGIYRAERYKDELAHARMFLSKPFGLDAVDRVAELLTDYLVNGSRPAAVADSVAVTAPSASREPWIPTSLLPLPRMLHLLSRDRRTGLLTQRANGHEVVFMLKDGRLHFVRSTAAEHRLDGVVAQLGKVSASALETARKELSERKIPTRFGEILVEMGVITREEMDRCLQIQLRRIIHSAFNEHDAEILFLAQELPEQGDVLLDLDARAVIVAGCAAARDDGNRLIGHLPDGGCVLSLQVDPEDASLKLSPSIKRLLATFDEPVHLSDFISMAELVGLRGRPLAFGLLCAGIISVSGAHAEWRQEVGVHGATQDMSSWVPAEMFLELEDRGATGLLRARLGQAHAWFAFENGVLRQAGSSDMRALLGQRLVEAGFIQKEALADALAAQIRSKGRPLGHVLMDMGLLSPEALRHSVQGQVLWVARDVLHADGWDEASFTEDELPDRDPLDLGVSVSDIVLEAMRHADSQALLMLAAALAVQRPTVNASLLESGRFTLTEAEELVSGAISSDSTQILRAIRTADQPDPDVLRTCVLALLLTPRRVAATTEV